MAKNSKTKKERRKKRLIELKVKEREKEKEPTNSILTVGKALLPGKAEPTQINPIEIAETNQPQDKLIYACERDGSLPSSLQKYFLKRYKLFSKYDQGCLIDQEGWYSVTPELVAKHIASRIRVPIVVDGFCGVGGNAIQLAQTCGLVIAIDIDPNRLALAQHNAKVYNVEHKIQFLLGDFFSLIKYIQCDAIFLSPPWGGPNYIKKRKFKLEWIQPKPGKVLFEVASQVCKNVAYYLPRNCDYTEVAKLDLDNNKVEIEQQFSGKGLVAITAYFGQLVKQ